MDYGKKDCEKPESELSPAERQAQLNEAVTKAVEKAFERYGVNINDPHAQQTDFKYLHSQRVTSEKLSQHTRFAIITAFVSGTAAMGWWILQHAFKPWQ